VLFSDFFFFQGKGGGPMVCKGASRIATFCGLKESRCKCSS